MQAEDARLLLAYDRWANRRVLAAACALSPAAFDRDLASSFGSVKGTLVHVLAGEWNWLRFFRGSPKGPLPNAEDFADAEAVAAAFEPLERESREFEQGLTDAALRATRRNRERDYSLGELLQHLINHSTYHRGQITTMLRQLGAAPPATDFRVFLDERATPAQRGGAA